MSSVWNVVCSDFGVFPVLPQKLPDWPVYTGVPDPFSVHLSAYADDISVFNQSDMQALCFVYKCRNRHLLPALTGLGAI